MKVRQYKGLTQEQVAEKAQLNLDDYIAMEEGKRLENKERLEKACSALDIKVEDLFDANTYINYGEISGNQSSLFSTTNYNQNSDSAVIEDMAKNIKYVTKNLDFLNNFVKVMHRRNRI